MNPFWQSLFGHLQDCGRHATIFIVTLAAFMGALVAVAIISESNLQGYTVYIMAGLAVLAMTWACFAFRKARSRRRERLQRGPLSDDELLKARCKLVRNRR